jgi:hypothetical protein
MNSLLVVDLNSKIFHPNIVLFMGACTKGTIKIVTELCVTDVEKLLHVFTSSNLLISHSFVPLRRFDYEMF